MDAGLAAGLRGLREGISERFGFQRKGEAAVFEENEKGKVVGRLAVAGEQGRRGIKPGAGQKSRFG